MWRAFAAGVCLSMSALPAAAQPLRIGFISTLSGANGGIGVEIRDGLELALKQSGDRVGGVAAEVVYGDDRLSPETGKQLADRMLRRDHVDVLTGIVFSPVMLAVAPQAFEAGVPYLSANAGPSQFAGAGCNRWFFNPTWQTDEPHEAMGRYLSERGIDNVMLVVPNFPGGRDAVAGFKRFYSRPIAAEIYTTLGQLDYAAEISQMRSARPGAVYFFLPSGMGINFIKQYRQSGIETPLYTQAFSADEDTFRAVGDSVIGVFNTSFWAFDLDNAANRAFVSAFRERYGRIPSAYAAQGYDLVRLLDAAVASIEGRTGDHEALRAAIKSAKFDSVRGPFRFNVNQNPIQNFYLRQVVRDEHGAPVNRLLGTVLTDHADAYAGQCAIK